MSMNTIKPKKIMVIFGTRPEATKMCPLVLELKKYPEWFNVMLVVTGQHREQLYQAMENFNLKPDADLSIMKKSQTLAYITTSAINGLDKLMEDEKPDLVLVHGDTQTSFCGALTAFYHKIPVGHVEAGLRSFKKYSPYPEEVNRRLVDVVADLLFAPTQYSRENLLKEGYKDEQIYVTGQTAVDAALMGYKKDYKFNAEKLNEIDFNSKRVVMVTAHRRENYGQPMKQMFKAIRRIAEENKDVLIVYPVHLSPVVRETANEILSEHERILLLDPIEFNDSVNLQARAHIILSDSGGLQEESVVFHKPMVLMRDTSERQEAIKTGAVYLAGTEEKSIYDIATKLLNDKEFYRKMAEAKNPFGDGRASERITNILAYHFGFTSEMMCGFDNKCN